MPAGLLVSSLPWRGSPSAILFLATGQSVRLVMAKDSKSEMEDTRRLMGALVRMKPMPHEDMKLGSRDRVEPKPTKARQKK
jgi:hypothetical protein